MPYLNGRGCPDEEAEGLGYERRLNGEREKEGEAEEIVGLRRHPVDDRPVQDGEDDLEETAVWLGL